MQGLIFNQARKTNWAEWEQHEQTPRMESGSDIYSHIAANRYSDETSGRLHWECWGMMTTGQIHAEWLWVGKGPWWSPRHPSKWPHGKGQEGGYPQAGLVRPVMPTVLRQRNPAPRGSWPCLVVRPAIEMERQWPSWPSYAGRNIGDPDLLTMKMLLQSSLNSINLVIN